MHCETVMSVEASLSVDSGLLSLDPSDTGTRPCAGPCVFSVCFLSQQVLMVN